MARYAITAPKAFGVSVATLKQLAKRLGRDHHLALALWDTGWYEARMLAAFVDEPARVTSAQMDRWAKDFDNWAICDTHCFHLFDCTPHAWKKVRQWSGRREEFVKRAAFALVAGIALHDKKAPDGPFLDALPLAERAAGDHRNFVKKAGELGAPTDRPPKSAAQRGRPEGRGPVGNVVERFNALGRSRRSA